MGCKTQPSDASYTIVFTVLVEVPLLLVYLASAYRLHCYKTSVETLTISAQFNYNQHFMLTWN